MLWLNDYATKSKKALFTLQASRKTSHMTQMTPCIMEKIIIICI